MSSKGIIAAVVLVVLVGISIYVWTSSGKEAGNDQGAMGIKEKFTCSKCNKTFELTVDQVRKERQANDGKLKCPLCGADDPEKQDVKIEIGSPRGGNEETQGFDTDKGGKDDEESGQKEDRSVAPPGMKKQTKG
jgi:hypothetical protein